MIGNDPNEQEQEVPDACFQCYSPDYEPGYQVKLCKSCRKRFSRYPLKKNILLGAIMLSIIFALSLYRFKTHYKAAISYEKGVDFADKREFISAENAFGYTRRLYPEHEKTLVHLATACFYNDKLREAEDLLNRLDREVIYRSNENLFEESETIRELVYKYDQQFRAMRNAEQYYQDNQLREADSAFKKIIRENPTNWTASILLSATLRREKQFKEALSECERTLSYNHQLPEALAEKAVVLLMLKKDKEALTIAEQAAAFAPSLSSVWFSLAAARYCNNDKDGAMEAYNKLKGLPADNFHPADSLRHLITEQFNLRNL